MRTQIKFHAIAIIAITVIIVAAYSITTARQQQAAAAANGDALNIVSATWGSNCAQAITEAQEARKLAPAPKDAETLTAASPNNALPALKNACNGKQNCELRVSSSTLGVDPMPSCFKRLSVSYRCFTFDHLTSLDIGQGEMLTIDCSNTKATDAAGKTKAQ